MQPETSPASFWKWFTRHADRLYEAMYGTDTDARDEAINELREALAPISEEVLLELCPGPDDSQRRVIISADGRPERADAVKEFVASAPTLAGWDVIAFRPPLPSTDSLEIALENERVGPNDVWFRLGEGEAGLELTLHVRGLTTKNERLRGLGAALLVEHSIGEQDAMTLLNSLQALALPRNPAGAGLRPFAELVKALQAEKQRRFPPPGQLPLDAEGSWQAMEGSMEGAVAFVLLNGGLQDVAGHPSYDRRLVVTILFNQTRDDGMPATREELVEVQELGDRISEALEDGQQSLLALTVTTQGQRQMHFHTSDAPRALVRIDALRSDADTHTIETAIEWDTFWGMYRSLCQAGGSEEEDE